jgi:hypothetical protein
MNRSFVKELERELRDLRTGKSRIEADPPLVRLDDEPDFVQVAIPTRTYRKLTRLAKRRRLNVSELLARVAEGA